MFFFQQVVDAKATVKRSSKPRRSSRYGHSDAQTNGHSSCDNNNGSAEEMQGMIIYCWAMSTAI